MSAHSNLGAPRPLPHALRRLRPRRASVTRGGIPAALAILGAVVLATAALAPAARCAEPAPATVSASPLPEGSYRDSCEKASLSPDGTTLQATCKQRDGSLHATSLANLADCTDAVTNLGGELHCNKGGVPPAGSYGGTCREIWLDHAVLHAACDDGTGKFVASQLSDLGSCTSTVANVFGHLTCPKGGKAPAGSYTASCWDVKIAGTALQATCRAKDGSSAAAQLADVRGCATVANHDGKLACKKAN